MINVSRFGKDQEPFLHAAFGTGHIDMINTKASKDGVVYLGLSTRREPGEIGAVEDMEGSLKDTEPQILLSFSNVESIDALVAMLDRCKESLLLNTPAQEPGNCTRDYQDDICPDCEFLNCEQVSHPGGDSKASVDKLSCSLGHWEDDF